MRPSEKPLDPRLSSRLEIVRTILGRWAEPVLLAYGNYAPHPEQQSHLEKMLQVCCDAAQQMTHAVGAAIAVAHGQEIMYVTRSGELASSIGARVNAESGFPGACVTSHKVFLSNHAEADRRVDPSVRRRGITSLIAFPLVENGEVLGFFEVFSRGENAFNVTHIVSLQFMASLVGQALSAFRQSKQCDPVGDGLRSAAPEAAATENHARRPEMASSPSLTTAQVVRAEPARIAPALSAPAIQLQTAAVTPLKQGPPVPELTASFSKSSSEIVEPLRITEASKIASASAKSSAERRCQTRTLVDSLVYVSLAEDNGGILLDVNDSGFSMQTALPLNPGSPYQRRARFTGNGDFEADCELVWDQGTQAGFKFLNVSADLRVRLQSCITPIGISPLSESVPVPAGSVRAQIVSGLAKLDELRSMLLNSKFTKV
jgi:hypothetical protein